MQEKIHRQICRNSKQITEWFASQRKGLAFPFYASFDLRDSNYKVVPVDANLFPAGFNNICQTDKETAADLTKSYLQAHYPQVKNNIVIITEEHTKNAYYWENVKTLVELVGAAGYKVEVAMPKAMDAPIEVESASGHKIIVHSAVRSGSGVVVDGDHEAELVISNNDFSREYPEFIEGLEVAMNPPYELGWYRRKKHQFFVEYNKLAAELAAMIDIEPWFFQVRTQAFSEFDINDEKSRDALAEQVELFLQASRQDLVDHGIDQEPFAFVKNNAGTYGLGVTQVRSGDEVRNWTYKARKKMKASKGGGGFTDVIIQEGVPSGLVTNDETQEPVIYMVGCNLAGGFLRTHSKKGPEESLNSPGAVYKRLCVTDLSIDVEGCPMENVYGWVARLAALTTAQEAKVSGIDFRGYA